MSDGAALFELTPQQQADLLETMLALKLETLTGPWIPVLSEALDIVGGLSLEQVTLIALRAVQAAVEVGSIAIGIPAGGTTGQSLVKASNTDFDTMWETITGGGGGGIPEAPTTGLIYGRQGSTTSWQLVLPLSGGTLTGPLILAADPGTNLGAATKQYVDATVAEQAIFEGVYRVSLNQPDLRVTAGNLDGYYWDAITLNPQVPDATVVALPGIPLGTLINNDDRIIWVSNLAQYQVITGGALTQPYADTLYLSLSGGTLTGPLILSGNPTQPLQAATMQYVDTRIPATTPGQVLYGSFGNPGAVAFDPNFTWDSAARNLTVNGNANILGVLQQSGQPFTTVAYREGTNAGDYTTGDPNGSWVDFTNLTITTVVPTGFVAIFWAVGSFASSGTGAPAAAGVYFSVDSPLTSIGTVQVSETDELVPFSLLVMIPGDGQTHFFGLAFYGSTGFTATIFNQGAKFPVMQMLMIPAYQNILAAGQRPIFPSRPIDPQGRRP